MSIYPENWPRCPKCGDYALDGHITCGRATCEEGQARRVRALAAGLAAGAALLAMLRPDDDKAS